MTEQTLRSLATAGAPCVTAPPMLAQQVIALHHRSVRHRRVGASLALVGVVAGGAVAARGGGQARFYDVYVPSGAMAPTVGIGEVLVADRTLAPAHDDVVQISFHNGGSSLTVKRIIGMPGDVIACPAGSDGFCHAWTRNGVALSEPWIGRDRVSAPDSAEPQPGFFVDEGDRIVPFPAVTVTSNHVFLLGDNRDNSVDSRLSDPDLQELSGVRGVGVQVLGADGKRRGIPGAPSHDVPAAGDTVDPPGQLPPAQGGSVPRPTG